MLFETILMIFAAGIAVFAIGLPAAKLVKSVIPRKTDPVAEAKARLEAAKKEVEAARLNKEADRLYAETYQETLEESLEETSELNKGKMKDEC